MALNPRQARFVAEYLIDLNAGAAAIRAGYSPHTAETCGPRLLRNAQIAAAVAEGKAKQLKSADLTASRVLEEIRRLALSDVRGLFDEQGNLKPVHTLTDEQAAAIGGIEVKQQRSADGERMDSIVKVKVWDKSKNLEMLAKHFALLTEKIELTGKGGRPVVIYDSRMNPPDVGGE
jgi:phage terminase small subunit